MEPASIVPQPRVGRSPTQSSIPQSRSESPRPHQFDKPTNDHTVSHRPRFSQKDYPPDCPSLTVRWYYAVDQPKKRAFPTQDQNAKPLKPAIKYVPFGVRDSRNIESAYQTLIETEDTSSSSAFPTSRGGSGDSSGNLGDRPGSRRNPIQIKDTENEDASVPVNEDYLFDVKVKSRELAPVYWLGPTYDVRRGTWFFQEGSGLRPCDENLATQLEEGYLKVKPFRQQPTDVTPNSGVLEKAPPSSDGLQVPTPENIVKVPQPAITQTNTWRLFGSYMNSFAVYADTQTAWLLTDDFYGKLSSTLYQRVTAGSHMGGLKLVRGYSEGSKPATEKKENLDTPISTSISRPVTPTPGSRNLKAEVDNSWKRKSMPPSTSESEKVTPGGFRSDGRKVLERQLSFLGPSKGEEEALEHDMKEDYKTSDDPGEEQERPIEHLLLVTHGIGQRLSMRMESVNFVHDINIFRKSLKGVYDLSPDLQALNSELGTSKKNCRIQCLPVCWRHLVDFPKQSLRQNRPPGEHDLGFGSQYTMIEEEYPSLADITVDGVPAVRSLITDLALDILLYQSVTYREHIARTVLEECNRIYALFKKRNPNFGGKVSLVGHSLGSAILFDLLCRQPDDSSPGSKASQTTLEFNFPVESFFCLGSPVGLFQMLKGRTIAARNQAGTVPAESPLDPEFVNDPFLATPSESQKRFRKPTYMSNFAVSSPKCAELFNIFHPTDPISYRLEPLISKAMAELKPQPLPYTKRGLFGTNQLAGGISGIGQSVSRGVSSMWSSLSSGIASSILNRSLGFDGNTSGGGSNEHTGPAPASRSGERSTTEEGGGGKGGLQMDQQDQQQIVAPTLADDEIITLYEGFQRRRKSEALERSEKAGEKDGANNPLNKMDIESLQKELAKDVGAEEKARQLKTEEAKVRALNSTGRIDFAIQEGVFDISLIASIASHLNYWSDEDVSHFMISQLLAKQKKKSQRQHS